MERDFWTLLVVLRWSVLWYKTASRLWRFEPGNEFRTQIEAFANVAMLTKMAMKFDVVSEPLVECTLDIDHEHEHRNAEHEHGKEPEQSVAVEALVQPFLTWVESAPRPS